MHGLDTFLSEPEWINPPWKDEVAISQHPLHTLLDIAYQVVPEVVLARQNRQWTMTDLKDRLRRLDRLERQLNEWEHILIHDHHGMLIKEKEAEWDGLHHTAYDFATLSGGMSFAMYAGVRIKMACTMNRIMGNILVVDGMADVDTITPVMEGLEWSRRALRCLEYFHTGSPKVTGYIATLFPLDAAWAYLSCIELNVHTDVSKERDFCVATAQRLSEMKIPVFRWR